MTRKSILFLIIAVFSLAMTSCRKDDSMGIPEAQKQRTILFYLAADNSLSSNGYKNIQNMVSGVNASIPDNTNLIVFFDPAGTNGKNTTEKPQLIRITRDREGNGMQQRIKTFPEFNSADPAALRSIIDEVCTSFPAEEYGLILWSHGTGWMPSQNALSRSFGQDGMSEIDLNDLVTAIPDNRFDFILFDACYMGGVEVAYTLRNKTPYIIASTTEILADGYPYSKILPDLCAQEVNLSNVCEKFYTHYASMSDQGYRSATVSLIRTQALDELASLVREIVTGKLAEIKEMPLGNLQWFDRFTHYMYDLDDYIKQIATTEQYTRFQQLMAVGGDLILYKNQTSTMLYGESDWFYIKRHCGLSAYIPRKGLTDINRFYQTLEWYKAVYE